MKKKLLLRLAYVLTGLLVVSFIGGQFTKVDSVNEEFTLFQDDDNRNLGRVNEFLESACFDCHSNSTHFPLYGEFYPISTFISGHIELGRSELNFSEWDELNLGEKTSVLQKCTELIETNDMPLYPYAKMHPGAIPDDVELRLIIESIDSLGNYYNDKNFSQITESLHLKVGLINGDSILYNFNNKGLTSLSTPLREILVSEPDSGESFILELQDSEDLEFYPMFQARGKLRGLWSAFRGFLICVENDEEFFIYYFDLAEFRAVSIIQTPLTIIDINNQVLLL